MSYRSRAFNEAPVQVPSALRLMTTLVVAFVMISLLVLLAGRVPLPPHSVPESGTSYKVYVARDTQLLSTYGYTTEGKVHIPIDRAMQLIVERGLPVRDNATATP
jgi:hypothetical protein